MKGLFQASAYICDYLERAPRSSVAVAHLSKEERARKKERQARDREEDNFQSILKFSSSVDAP